MRQMLMATCVLIVLSCDFIDGRSMSKDNRGSDMLAARAPKPEDFLDYERRAFSTLPHGNSLILPKIRQKRQSDQVRADWETLMSLCKYVAEYIKRNTLYGDPIAIGRRKRARINEKLMSRYCYNFGKLTKQDSDSTYYRRIS